MTEQKQETWRVLRAQSGDLAALDELLKAVQMPLFRYIASLTNDTALAEDILQETFLLIYRKLPYLREAQLFRPWAYRIATREAFAQLKKRRSWPEQLDETTDDSAAPPDEFLSEWRALLPQLIVTLSPASRAVIVLHYLHELTLEEVAAVLGIKPGTVKSRLAYGLAALRELSRQQQLS